MPERKYEIPAGDEIDYAADFESWLEKGATAKQVQFGDFVSDKADLASYFKTAKEVEAAKLGVQLALKWRMLFQRSPENHDATNEARQARAQEAAARPTRKAKAQDEDAEPETPKRRGRPAKAAAAEAPAAPARRGRRAAAATTPATEAKAPVAKPGRRPAAAGRPRAAARKGAAAKEADF